MCPVLIKWKTRLKKGSLYNPRLFRRSHSLSRQNNINFTSCSRQAENQTAFSAENEIALDHHGGFDQALLEKLARKWDICKRNSKHSIAINVSELCAAVLQSLAKARAHQHILKDFLQRRGDTRESDADNLEMMQIFVETENPFCGKMSEKFELVLRDYEEMNERFQRKRNVRRTFRFARKILGASSVFVVVTGASLVLVSLAGVLMLLTALLAGPLAITIPVQVLSLYRTVVNPLRRRRVKTRWRQHNIASLSAFVVKHSLRTMDLLIARLRNDVENIRNQLRFFLEHRDDDKIGLDICEQLQRNQETFSLLLNDLEASILSEWT